ncbi:hypothetical protein COU78_02330 [Candidatus Peregrinibacteria bacterium CG10_big_fil_rev_8_21_14_0_10_49_24]|nr:MAG: hypothetical protein COV83_02310 [Candidatus Peregrinibacteria bacterium CG11_big_fil_rev_8_21_14_0_20_49_14]PIR50974.1 MAG: hypothetical protein COU78_02330 [Candidatus Peregrinibacteria bacterium CG10_big_fil_rev_8_21_14_0_10_49_24]PJA67527.1 MAG: hypothetical protein CO157_03810 [Candidatus Peregrinibacteria bacterium CG_4_9_14_3_um_filter_49_12]
MKSVKLFLLASLLLASCAKEPLPPLPKGEQTVSGILMPAELSLARRGTHVLTKNGKELYFVESTLITLRAYERKMVTLRGVLEPNIDDKLLPVLVVESVVESETTTKRWDLTHLLLSLDAPKEWTHTKEGGTSFFFAPSQEKPVLSLSAQDAPEEFPFGVSIVVDGFPAVRIINEQTGTQAVYVHHGDTMLTMLFSADQSPNAAELREQWLSLLASLELHTEDASSSQQPALGSGGAVTGGPCGGPAGVLCPSGQYCEVTDTEQDIGTCTPL